MPNHGVKNHNVKLIRMQSGEDIMASTVTVKSTKEIHLYDPMRLVFRRLPTGQTIMMMMPWLPMELIETNAATIYSSDVITMVEPKAAMIEYYGKIVDRLIEEMADSDEMLQRLLDEHEEESEEAQYEADDGALTKDQLEQILKDIKTNKLH